jgi:hypothetical protein
MPLNLIKKYPELLELAHYNESQRIESLKRIFIRDIQENENFKFRKKTIRPIKKEGMDSMDVLFDHLTKKTEFDENNNKKRDCFEIERSRRLHWVKFHIDERLSNNLEVFSFEDRLRDRGSVVRTYIFDKVHDYVIILEPQRSKLDYYLITAYLLNEPGGKKSILKKLKNRLQEIY